MENEILLALIGKMVDDRINGLPVVSAIRGPRGLSGRNGNDGKDFVFSEHEETIRSWAKEFALKFENLSQEEIESLRGPRGRDGTNGKDFVLSEHEEEIRAWSKEFALKFEDLSDDQVQSLRGPRGHDGASGSDGHSFVFEENRDAINAIISEAINGIREDIRLKFSDLNESEIEQLRGPRGRDGHDGRNFIFDDHKDFFEGLRLKFSDLTEEEKSSLKIQFSNFTEEEKHSLKLKFDDLTSDDKLSLRGPRGIRGQRGSQGRDGKDGKSGVRGLPGPQGFRGLQGNPGLDGEDGEDGDDAPCVVAVDVDDFGDEIAFVFEFSDGSSLRTDRVKLPAPVNVYGMGGGAGGGGGSKMDYETIVDEANSTTTYVGYAIPGHGVTSEASWKIKRISISGTETIIEFADSNALFDNVWDDRASLTYG